jgi:hypothetical protein
MAKAKPSKPATPPAQDKPQTPPEPAQPPPKIIMVREGAEGRLVTKTSEKKD